MYFVLKIIARQELVVTWILADFGPCINQDIFCEDISSERINGSLAYLRGSLVRGWEV